ncbi:hypothetical protein ACFWBH_10320 [Streptomyces sp. NPDC059999]|uniref:hypothetical protein n=1 Tax=Streptomyces sp. NPDC059999 TaxID=3347030 RepID=UPI00368E1E7C
MLGLAAAVAFSLIMALLSWLAAHPWVPTLILVAMSAHPSRYMRSRTANSKSL